MSEFDLALPDRHRPVKTTLSGLVGDFAGVIDVAGRPGWIYVRAGGAVRRVFDGKRVAPRVAGALVYYEEIALAPGHYQVIDLSPANSQAVLALGGYSAARYQYGGPDVMMVDLRQVKQGLVTQTKTPSMYVRTGDFWFYWEGTRYEVLEQELASAITAPASGNARWDLIGVSVSTLLLTVTAGTPGSKDFPEALAKPAIPANTLPLAYLLVYDTTVALTNGANIRSIAPYFTWTGSGVASSRQIIAGAGLSGGGDLSADRTLALDIHELGAETVPAASDEVAIYRAGTHYRMARSDFVAGLGGGGVSNIGGGMFQKWEVDSPPATAHADDDEFDDLSISGAWTQWDPASATTFAEAAHGLTLTQSAAGSGANRFAGIVKARPSGDFSIVTKVSLQMNRAHLASHGIILAQDLITNPTTGDLLNFQISPVSMGLLHMADYATYTTGWLSYASLQSWTGALYARVRLVSTTVHCDYSFDGISWYTLGSQASPITITHVGLAVNFYGSGSLGSAAYKFFRVTTDVALATPVGGQLVNFGFAPDAILTDSNGDPLSDSYGNLLWT